MAFYAKVLGIRNTEFYVLLEWIICFQGQTEDAMDMYQKLKVVWRCARYFCVL